MKSFLWNGALICLFILCWHGFSVSEIVPSYLIPGPLEVIKSFIEMKVDLMSAAIQTSTHAALGLALSLFVGFILGLLSHSFLLLKKTILSVSIFFQTVPIIAIAPLFLIYFGFGTPTVVASAFIVSLFPVLANTLIGLDTVPKEYLDLFKLHSASKRTILLKLRVPHAYPQILGGIKVSLGLSIVGAVAGEFVAGGGLGALIDSARTQQRVDIVFACLMLLMGIGILFLSCLKIIHLRIIKARPLMTK